MLPMADTGLRAGSLVRSLSLQPDILGSLPTVSTTSKMYVYEEARD